MTNTQNRKTKIAIIVRKETAMKCIGKGCLRAFNQYGDSFKRYQGKETELVAFCDDSGTSEDPLENIRERIERFKKTGVEVVHISTCNRAKNPNYNKMVEMFAESFEVVGYTHGSEVPGHQQGISDEDLIP